MKRFLKYGLCLLLVVMCVLPSVAAGNISGQEINEVSTLYDGVTLTHKTTTADRSAYGLQNFNIVEFDPAQSNLYMDVVGAGQYANNRATVTKMVSDFNANNPDKKVVAAVNGDLWMMSSAHARIEGKGTNYNGYTEAVVKGDLTLPRSFNIYQGEIITSAYMYQETPYEGEFWAFGSTDDGRVVIGCPTLEITITSGRKTVHADGLNRLPANDALVLYTDRGCQSNKALDDAYEILVDVGQDYTVTDGASITGTIIGIYDENTEENPTISPTTMILTARGTRARAISSYKVGDSISFDFEVGERYGRQVDTWKEVTNAVGGHMAFVVDGVKSETGTTIGYPTTIVGIKNDGTMCIVVNDGRQNSISRGLDFNDYALLTDELDLNTGIILDGGGSAEMVVADGDDYRVANHPSDGQERAVINALILSVGKDRETTSTEVATPSSNIDLLNINFQNKNNLTLIKPNIQTSVTYTTEGAKIVADNYNTTTHNTSSLGDGYFNLSFSLPESETTKKDNKVDIDQYPYIVLDMKCITKDPSKTQFQTVYVDAGDRWAASAPTFCQYNNISNDGQFHSYIIDTTANSVITGKLNLLRIGYLIQANGTTVKNGYGIVLRSVKLAKTLEEANTLANSANTNPFTDVASGKWYTDSVNFVYQAGLMTGTTTTTFAPSTEITRAQFAVILANMDGADTSSYTTSPFSDVAPGKWYSNQVAWAYDMGLCQGTGDGKFSPSGVVTREQIAVFLYNYAQYKGEVNTHEEDNLAAFSDASRVHSWAEQAMNWAVGEGLIAGSGGALNPRGNCTRAQLAQILVSYFGR